MPDDDAFRSHLQATIASLSYWVPAISDAARVEQSETEGRWQLKVRPLFAAACPFALTLSRDGSYTLSVDGVSYPDRPIESLDVFLPLVEAISEGRIMHKRWSSRNTGVETTVETIIDLGKGRVWSAARHRPGADEVSSTEDVVGKSQYFLPYRRR